MPAETPDVVHNAANARFEIATEGALAVLEYSLSGGRITFVHTEVPVALEGRGLGGRLAQAGLEYAGREGLRVVPQCPFVRKYIERHPQYQRLMEE